MEGLFTCRPPPHALRHSQDPIAPSEIKFSIAALTCAGCSRNALCPAPSRPVRPELTKPVGHVPVEGVAGAAIDQEGRRGEILDVTIGHLEVEQGWAPVCRGTRCSRGRQYLS